MLLLIVLAHAPLFLYGSEPGIMTILNEIGNYGFGSDLSKNDQYIQSLKKAIVYFTVIPISIHFLYPILLSVLVGIWFGRKHLLTDLQQQNSRLKIIATIGITISLLGAFPLVLIGEIWEPSLFLAGVMYGIHMITGTAGGVGYAALFGNLYRVVDSKGNTIDFLLCTRRNKYVRNQWSVPIIGSSLALLYYFC